jgi:Mesyanzhinovviridae DNA primase
MTINPKWLFGHCALIHDLAGRTEEQGKLIVTAFGEDPSQLNPKTEKPGLRLTPKVVHFDIGDPAPMAKYLREIAGQRHYNTYIPLAIFRADLPPGAKGGEKDIVACFGLVADFDDPDAARWEERLPIPPQYVLETSTGRFQAFYLFKEPVPLGIAKPVAARLKAYADCDHGTADISHVWRVAGTLNWPNAKKISEGRSAEPQLVKIVQPFLGETIPFEKLAAALPEGGTAKNSKPGGTRSKRKRRTGQPHPAAVEGSLEWNEAQIYMNLYVPEELHEQIRQPVSGDRSKALFSVIAQLIKREVPDEIIERVIYAHPKGIGEKYADRHDLDTEIARVRYKTADPFAAVVEELNEQYAVVDDNGKTCVVYRRWDDTLGREYVVSSSFHDFRNLYLNDYVQITGGNSKVRSYPKAEIWLSHRDRRTYKQGLRFLPGVSESPDGVYNLWAGWGVEPSPGDWSLMQAHIKDVICSGNQERFEYLVNWLARAVQKPGEQGEVAVVLRGARGIGKGAFARAFGELFGQHFLHLSDARHLTGNFNAHLRDTCAVFADEAFYAADKQHEGQLKRLVTEPTLMIEPKFRNAAQARNCLHVIVSSNDDWVIPAGMDERRFFVLDVSSCRKKDFSYFAALEAELRNGGAEAMLYDLLRRDLTGFNVRDVPSTEALLDQKVLSFRGPEGWWFDVLVEGFCPGASPKSENGVESDFSEQDWTQPVRVSRRALYDDYREYSARMREYRPTPKGQFAKLLRKFVPGLTDERPREGATRNRLYIIPPLTECRLSFEELIDGPIAWEQT